MLQILSPTQRVLIAKSNTKQIPKIDFRRKETAITDYHSHVQINDSETELEVPRPVLGARSPVTGAKFMASSQVGMCNPSLDTTPVQYSTLWLQHWLRLCIF